MMEIQTVKIEGRGQFSATAKMMARFVDMKKRELAAKIAEGYATKGAGVAYWRELPRETLNIVAGDMFATDEERGQRTSVAQPATVPPAVVAPPAPVAQSTPDTSATVLASDKVPGPYVLKVVVRPNTQDTPGWLRRDQPRKPGEKAVFKVVERPKATVYLSLRQAEAKLAEAALLLPDVKAEIKPISDKS